MLDIGEAHHVEQFDPGIADDRDLEAGDGACLHQSAQISPHGSARGLVGGRVVHSCVSCAGTAVKKRCLKAFLSGLPTAVSGMRSTISMRFGVCTGPLRSRTSAARSDRKSVVEGKSVSVRVDLGGRRIIKK